MTNATVQQITSQLKKIEHQLVDIREHLGLSEENMQTKRAQVLKRTAGVLKHKVVDDIVAWQKKVRAQWGV